MTDIGCGMAIRVAAASWSLEGIEMQVVQP